MPPDLKIRRAVTADAECLIAYMTRLVNEPHNNIVLDPGQWRQTVQEEIDFLRQASEDPNKFFIVAEIPQGIVGVANITRNSRPTAAHTASLAVSVDAAWRRQGIGGALMAAMLEWAQSQKLRRVELKVFTRNTAAVPLYRKFGFLQEGLHRMAFCKQGQWVDEYTMALCCPLDAIQKEFLMLTTAQVQQFQRDGYLKGSPILTAGEAEELCNEMERVLNRFKDNFETAPPPKPVLCRNLSPDPANPVWQIVNIYDASEPFRRLVFNRTITEEIAQLSAAREIRMWHDQIQYKPATTGGVNMWHQDAPYWPVLAPMHQVTAWVALDDVDEANGCMSMVPGSHQWGNEIEFLQKLPAFDAMPSTYKNHAIAVKTCPVKRGQVHYHHSLTWHGSAANTSTRKRRAIALHYMPGETRFVAAGKHPMKPFITVQDGQPITGDHFPVVWPQ